MILVTTTEFMRGLGTLIRNKSKRSRTLQANFIDMIGFGKGITSKKGACVYVSCFYVKFKE